MADKNTHARLVIHEFDVMLPHTRKRLIAWLRKLADDLETIPHTKFAARFTARLFK